jgi:hypothetical protein
MLHDCVPPAATNVDRAVATFAGSFDAAKRAVSFSSPQRLFFPACNLSPQVLQGQTISLTNHYIVYENMNV